MQKLSTSTQERLMSNQENTKTARISPHVKTQKPQNKRGIKEEASETAQSRQHQPDEAERTEDVSVLSRRLVLTSLVAAPAFVHGHHVGGDYRWQRCWGWAHSAEAFLSANPNVDGALVRFQLQPRSPDASDHTICQTIPGGTFPLKHSLLPPNAGARAALKIPPFFLLPLHRLGDGYDGTHSLWTFSEHSLTAELLKVWFQLKTTCNLKIKALSQRCVRNNKLGLVTGRSHILSYNHT